MSGQPQEHVKHRQLPCRSNSEHGTTRHAQYASGKSSMSWQCMVCNAERSAARYERVKEEVKERGGPLPKPPEPPKPVLCPSCFIALPVTGVCSECEE